MPQEGGDPYQEHIRGCSGTKCRCWSRGKTLIGGGSSSKRPRWYRLSNSNTLLGKRNGRRRRLLLWPTAVTESNLTSLEAERGEKDRVERYVGESPRAEKLHSGSGNGSVFQGKLGPGCIRGWRNSLENHPLDNLFGRRQRRSLRRVGGGLHRPSLELTISMAVFWVLVEAEEVSGMAEIAEERYLGLRLTAVEASTPWKGKGVWANLSWDPGLSVWASWVLQELFKNMPGVWQKAVLACFLVPWSWRRGSLPTGVWSNVLLRTDANERRHEDLLLGWDTRREHLEW